MDCDAITTGRRWMNGKNERIEKDWRVSEECDKCIKYEWACVCEREREIYNT